MYDILFKYKDVEFPIESNFGEKLFDNFGNVMREKIAIKPIENISGLPAKMNSTWLSFGPEKFIKDAQKRGKIASVFDWIGVREEEISGMQLGARQTLDSAYRTGQISEERYNLCVQSILAAGERASEEANSKSIRYFLSSISDLIQ